MKNKTLLRILVPLLILAVAAGIYFVKDYNQKQEAARQLALAGDPAFVLQETSFDLLAYQAHGLPLILDFGADDCVPCQVMKPALLASHEKMLGKAVIKYFDVWKQPDLAVNYPVKVVPTQVFYLADGSPYVPSAEVEAAGLRFLIYNDRDSQQHMVTAHEGILSEEQFDLILADMGAKLEAKP